jgi:hypothetical protein
MRGEACNVLRRLSCEVYGADHAKFTAPIAKFTALMNERSVAQEALAPQMKTALTASCGLHDGSAIERARS